MDKRLIWLGAGSFIIGTVGFVFSSLLPAIAADNHVGIVSAGHLITAFSLSYAVFAPVLSALAGSIDRRSVLIISMLAFVAGNLGAAASDGYGMLFAAQIVIGAAAALFAATAQATAVGLVEPQFRARAVSVVVAGTTFAVALGAPAGSLLATFSDWRSTFGAIAALGLACAAVLWWKLPNDLRGGALTLRERVTVVVHPGVLPALLVTFFYIAGGFAVFSYIAPLALNGAGLPPLALPGLLVVYGIGAVAGNLTSGQLADRLGATRVVTFSILGSTLLCLAIVAALKLLPRELAGPALFGLMLPWGVTGWMFPPAQASRLVALAPELSQLTLGLNVSALYFGVGVGTLIGGQFLGVAGPADLGLLGAALGLVALAILAVSGRRVVIAAE